jgi:hypothetical protein
MVGTSVRRGVGSRGRYGATARILAASIFPDMLELLLTWARVIGRLQVLGLSFGVIDDAVGAPVAYLSIQPVH